MKKKLKICFFTTDFPPTVGGISEFSHSIAKHLSFLDDVEHVQVIVLKNRYNSKEKIQHNFSVVRRMSESFVDLFAQIFKYSFHFRNYDIFHATSVFPVGFLTVLIGKYILQKPVVVTFYGTDVLGTEGSFKTKLAKSFTLRHASHCVAFSESTKNATIKKHALSEERCSVIYYPLADKPAYISDNKIQDLKNRFRLLKDDFIILFVGHLVRRKGPEDLIRALSLILDRRIKLLFVGKGPEENKLKNLANDLKLNERVIFVGEQSAIPFYSIANIFSMPSFFDKEAGDIEGLGIVFLEAQQRGIPVIGTNSGGIPEALEDGKSGFLVPERDPEALKEKILLLARDKTLRVQMGKQGQHFVNKKFNWRLSAQGHIALYRSLLKK